MMMIPWERHFVNILLCVLVEDVATCQIQRSNEECSQNLAQGSSDVLTYMEVNQMCPLIALRMEQFESAAIGMLETR